MSGSTAAPRSGVSRRRILATVPPLTAAALFASPRAHAAATIDAATYPSLQAAIDATPDGGTVTTTKLNQKFAGATLRGRKGITLSGLNIVGVVTFAGCTSCVIRNCSMSGKDGVAVFLSACTGCTITRCTITASRIAAYSPVNCTFSSNTITNSPSNGIGVVGYRTAPATNNRYIGNVINWSKRIGIEEYPTEGDVTTCRGAVFQSNQINSPVGMGISAMGLDPQIIGNTIQNAGWAAVEVTGNQAVISSNRISHKSPAASGIMVNGTLADLATAAVSVTGNEVTGHAVGISLISTKPETPIRNVTISGNTLTNCADVGINACPTYSGGGLVVNDNTFTLDAPTGLNRTRVALKTGTGISFDGNRITYTPASAGMSADMPIHLVGNDVTLANTTVDGGGRTASSMLQASAAVAPAGSYSGWQYLANQHINGATINKSGTRFTIDTDLA